MIMGMLSGVIGVLSAIVGCMCLAVAVALVLMSPWTLLWLIPAALWIRWMIQRSNRRRKAAASFQVNRDWQELYPEGFVPAHRQGQPIARPHHEPMEHRFVEPISIGGYNRSSHVK